jgi:DNA-binding transcriptional regulator GbsR (MarR family)
MLVIDKLVEEFETANNELNKALKSRVFNEVSDYATYLTAITRAMTIVLDAYSTEYTLIDRQKVDRCISTVNRIYND